MQKPIGILIYEYCKRNNKSLASLASSLHIDLSGLYRSLRSKNITVERVRAISQILNHNFFDDYYSAAKHPGSNTEYLVNENRQLKAKVHQLESDMSNLRDLIGLLKSKSG